VSTELLHTLLTSLQDELPAAVALRERLHASPEPSNAEHGTSRLVAEALEAPDVEPVAGTGLLARAGQTRGRPVAVRAELDALPILEQTGAPFAADNGLMHACGHDLHMAALTALFRAARRSEGSLGKPLLALY
jgi:metal-dependent amidase/aminoacylase/carboxypeptidase family protein